MKFAFKHLLAKSCEDSDNPPLAATLEGHTQAVLNAFRTLFGTIDSPSRLAMQWLDFFLLPRSAFPTFYINGLFSCLLHDMGKANSGFQEMIRRKGRQLVRHEHLSAVFLQCPEIQQWIISTKDADADVIRSCVLGHHLKAKPQNNDFADYMSGVDQSRFSLDVALVTQKYLDLALSVPEISEMPSSLSLPERWNFDKDNPGTVLKDQAATKLKKYKRTLQRNPEQHQLLIATRAALIVADSAGSGLVREGKDIFSWIQGAFNNDDLLTDDSIENKILAPRQKEIETNTGKPFVWQDFQKAAGNLPDRAVLLSGCGSGKTLAAWRWIKQQVQQKPAARAIFLYPTKATASEGFKDYVSWAPEGILLHSSSQFDLQGMFENPEDRPGNGDFLVEERLFALAYWNRQIFSATVHQFLGFLQHSYRSVCLLPLLVDSVVVIDEIHSFDKALFSALKDFLKHFNVPTLCMTATLPQQRQKELAELGLTLFPQDTSAFINLHEKTSAPRYKVRSLGDDQEQVEEAVADALNQGKKILWVVNTVDRCQLISQKFSYANALCYHSRFKLEDRKKRHQKVIHSFQDQPGPLLAVTTQVCEMSLDLDADLLISEAAPITSMIQRMGRCNRRLHNPDLGTVYFYLPENMLPYDEEDMTGVESFLAAIDGQQISQEDLEDLLEKFGNNAREVKKYTAFLSDRAWAESRAKELADIKETSVQAILQIDIPEYFELLRKKEPFDGLLIPVPKYPAELTWQGEKIGRYPLITRDCYYNQNYGFSKQPYGLIL